MRKLKAGLVLLFSILMSLCLFACTPAEENPNPDDSSGETGKVLSARFQSDTATITLTDEQAKVLEYMQKNKELLEERSELIAKIDKLTRQVELLKKMIRDLPTKEKEI